MLMKQKRIIFLLLLIASQLLQACSLSPTTCDELTNGEQCLRILFIGNSYTFYNDLPGTFAELARAGGHQVEVQMVANGGAPTTLNRRIRLPRSNRKNGIMSSFKNEA